ncbi:MAG: 50S ribosomal protein L20 [Patescibacteria group bacterium]|nr:50S ribosomal protein L20 [Patescibacteria group bacterium]MCL5224070.1 50S ribosomal protein L20 [Patescibacteria group bacterium]
MARVKRGKIAAKKRRKILKYTKGFRWSRKSKERAAKEALLHAWSHSFRGRKEEKRVNRTAWQAKINAAARGEGVRYSELIHTLKANNIKLDRKVLANIAENEPAVFKKIVASLKS